MNNIEFVKRVQAIAATNPTYRTGGDGNDGTCDCVGLIMGALGKEYPMHSSNYFERYEMESIGQIKGNEHHMALGDLVYKAKTPGDAGYDLHERYQAGGRYHNGDLLDYYHVGVVTSTNPLKITHCTSTDSVNGIKSDTSLKGWTHFGQIAGVPVVTEGDVQDLIQHSEHDTMIVFSENGKPVNVRERQSKNALKIAEIEVGTVVVVIDKTQDWAHITHSGYTGYMMSEFLQEIGNMNQEKEPESVTITIPKTVAEALKNELETI